jgi:hypothetical protein
MIISGAIPEKFVVSYEDENGNAVDVSQPSAPLPVQDVNHEDLVLLLTRLLNALNSPQGYDKSLQRQRGTVVLESGTVTTVSGVTTVSTVTTVAGLTNIDGRNGSMLINQTNLSAWANCVRSRIT